MRGKIGNAGVVLMVVIWLVVSTPIHNYLSTYSVAGAQFFFGAVFGLLLVIAWAPPQRLSWLGELIILVPLVAVLRWIALPLVSQYLLGGIRLVSQRLLGKEPLFAGFDGSNPAVLVPGALYLAGFCLVYGICAFMARRKLAAN